MALKILAGLIVLLFLYPYIIVYACRWWDRRKQSREKIQTGEIPDELLPPELKSVPGAMNDDRPQWAMKPTPRQFQERQTRIEEWFTENPDLRQAWLAKNARR